MHVGNENDVFFDQLRELREWGEAIEKISAHRQHEFDRTSRVLRDLEQRGDETRTQPLFGTREDFLELIHEEEPLVAFSLELADKPSRYIRLRIEQLARLGLAKSTGLECAAQRLGWVYVRNQDKVAKPCAN